MKIKYSKNIDDKDIKDILNIVRRVGVFNKEEIKIAKELLLNSKSTPSKRYYRYITAKIDDKMAGYACYAKIDGTDGRYELYWIAVSPDFQRKGISKGILEEFERIVAKENGKKIIIITSSKPDYISAKCTYEKCGYTCAAVLKDYFSDGDDEIFYEKRIKKSEKIDSYYSRTRSRQCLSFGKRCKRRG